MTTCNLGALSASHILTFMSSNYIPVPPIGHENLFEVRVVAGIMYLHEDICWMELGFLGENGFVFSKFEIKYINFTILFLEHWAVGPGSGVGVVQCRCVHRI